MSDTPRTDAVWEAAGRGPVDGPEKWLDAVSRNMERELAEAKAEVERLKMLLKKCDHWLDHSNGCKSWRRDFVSPDCVCSVGGIEREIEEILTEPNSLQPKPLQPSA